MEADECTLGKALWNDGMVLKDIMKTVGPGKMHRYSNNNHY